METKRKPDQNNDSFVTRLQWLRERSWCDDSIKTMRLDALDVDYPWYREYVAVLCELLLAERSKVAAVQEYARKWIEGTHPHAGDALTASDLLTLTGAKAAP